MATVKRDPRDVIAAILPLIPEEFAQLRGRLQRLKEESACFPPEWKYPIWLQLGFLLTNTLYVPPKLPWEQRISDIVTGRVPLPPPDRPKAG